MNKIFISLFLLLPMLIFSQENDKKEVMMVVNNVFEAMRTNDSTLLKSCFTKEPKTFTVYENLEGKISLGSGDFRKFVEFVGNPKEVVYNEPIWHEKVEIDGGLASVWADYALYADDEFIHCGVDAFHLVKQNGEWKIFHLVDTRRKENCEIP